VNVRELRRGVKRFVEGLEDSMIDAAAAVGVEAHGRVAGGTGVWAGPRGPVARKLGAIGIRISEGVSTHGLAMNVARGLATTGGGGESPFSLIVPCG